MKKITIIFIRINSIACSILRLRRIAAKSKFPLTQNHEDKKN